MTDNQINPSLIEEKMSALEDQRQNSNDIGTEKDIIGIIAVAGYTQGLLKRSNQDAS